MPDTKDILRTYWSAVVAETPPPDADVLMAEAGEWPIESRDVRLHPETPSSPGRNERTRWVVAVAAGVLALMIAAPIVWLRGGTSSTESLPSTAPAEPDGGLMPM